MSVDRKAAREAWKQLDTEWTVYAARTGGETWVGVASDVAAIENRLNFTLKLGDCRAEGMQKAWDGTLTVEPLEVLDPTLGPLMRDEAIKDRRAHWCAELGATPILR